VVNALTSLFVEATMEHAAKDQDNATHSALESTESYMDKLSNWFAVVDEDGSGTIDYSEFCRHLEDPQMLAFASTLGIEIVDVKQFF